MNILPSIPPDSNHHLSADLLSAAGQAANRVAAANVFFDYTSRKAQNTLRRQAADLACLADFLRESHIPAGDLAADPEAWRGMTWGLVETFKRWMLGKGLAVSTVNFRLSTVKVYAELAAMAQPGVIDARELSLIKAVSGYAHKEVKRIDEQRLAEGLETRASVKSNGQRSTKKAETVPISLEQARRLKTQPDTPQGRRDALLMAILLDHGLRCGEVAGLRVENFQFSGFKDGRPTRGTMSFYRPKVDKTQTHKLTTDSLAAAWAYLSIDHPAKAGPLWLASKKAGHKGDSAGRLAALGMGERSITERVNFLGNLVGITGLSAHDCRHYWATQAARNGTHMDRLKDAGGWSSLAMPARYIEAAAIANEGVNLGSD